LFQQTLKKLGETKNLSRAKLFQQTLTKMVETKNLSRAKLFQQTLTKMGETKNLSESVLRYGEIALIIGFELFSVHSQNKIVRFA